MTETPKHSRLAVLSLLLGVAVWAAAVSGVLVSVPHDSRRDLGGLLLLVALFLAIVGLVLGIFAVRRAGKTAFAVIGLSLDLIFLLPIAIAVLLALIFPT